MKCESNKIHAPYHFVPLSEFVFQPDWHKQVSHSRPIADGISGALELKISAYTPLLLGEHKSDNDQEKGDVYPYRLPNGEYAIPSSSLRGMIRNVLEIASFGKMRNVDDKRYSVRDLSAAFYKEPLNDVTTGWLHYMDNEWFIYPCNYNDIFQKKIHRNWTSIFEEYKKPQAADKYHTYLTVKKTLQFSCKGRAGYLVFTGQPSDRKKKDFVFYAGEEEKRLLVEPRVMQDFLTIYQDSEHWKYLKQHHTHIFPQQGTPVFFLQENGQQTGRVTSLGLSKMYKLAYKNSIGDMLDYTSTVHRSNNKYDLAELIFGTVDEDDGKQSIKGRVSFSTARCDTPAEQVTSQSHDTILNSPKPTFYPNYIRQQSQQDQPLETRLQTNEYQTYMDDAEIRGWKRYPVRKEAVITEPSQEQKKNKKIQVTLKPLDASQDAPLHFTGKMRFHNLRPTELGALIWALTWGDNPGLRHAIGMGKAFGLGQLGIKITDSDFIPNDVTVQADTLTEYQQAFMAMMAAQYNHSGGDSREFPSWRFSESLLHLMAMADPRDAVGKSLTHMELGCFAALKSPKHRQVLTEYIDTLVEKRKRIKESYTLIDEPSPPDDGTIKPDDGTIEPIPIDEGKKAYINRFPDKEKAEQLYALKGVGLLYNVI